MKVKEIMTTDVELIRPDDTGFCQSVMATAWSV